MLAVSCVPLAQLKISQKSNPHNGDEAQFCTHLREIPTANSPSRARRRRLEQRQLSMMRSGHEAINTPFPKTVLPRAIGELRGPTRAPTI